MKYFVFLFAFVLSTSCFSCEKCLTFDKDDSELYKREGLCYLSIGDSVNALLNLSKYATILRSENGNATIFASQAEHNLEMARKLSNGYLFFLAQLNIATSKFNTDPKLARELFSQSRISFEDIQCVKNTFYSILGQSGCSYLIGDFDSFAKYLAELDVIYRSSVEDLGDHFALFLSFSALEAGITGDIEKAIKNSIMAIDHEASQDAPDLGVISASYINLAANYETIGDYAFSMKFLEEAERVYLSKGIERDRQYCNVLSNKLLLAEKIGKPDSLLHALNNKFKVCLKNNKNSYSTSDKIVNAMNSGRRTLDKRESIRELLVLMENYEEVNLTYMHLISTISMYYEELEDFQNAIRYEKRALEIIKEKIQLGHKELGRYMRLGILYNKTNQPELALEACQNGIMCLSDKQEELNDYLNLRNVHTISEKLLAIKIAKEKSAALYSLIKESPKDSCLIDALENTNRFLLELIPAAQKEILSFRSKSQLHKNSSEVFEQIMRQAFESGNNDLMFAVAERSKSALLLEQLADDKSMELAGIPDSVSAEFRSSKRLLSYYQGKLVKENFLPENERDSLKIATWNDKVVHHQTELSNGLKRMKRDYPMYAERAKDYKTQELRDIQRSLPVDECIVEYMTIDSEIFALYISRDSCFSVQIPFMEELEREIDDYLLSLTNKSSDLSLVEELGKAVWSKLIPKGIRDVIAGCSKITVIPDGRLALLPFELMDVSGESLVDSTSISYAYSCSILAEERLERSSKGSVLAFAPSFGFARQSGERSCRDEELAALFCGSKELEEIAEYHEGDFVSAESATIAQFEERAPGAAIIHLATHACAHEEDPFENRVYFSDGSLTTRELINMDLSADLAVLSACETGAGELVEGEGVMSLSRSFMYGGIPSVVMSLWSVDDCSTAKLMGHFYRHLADGLPKDVALRNAKMDFLETASKRHRHPYYWAGFVLQGDCSAINTAKKSEGLFAWLSDMVGLN